MDVKDTTETTKQACRVIPRIKAKDEANIIYEENRAISDRFKKFKSNIIGVWTTVSDGYAELINVIPCDARYRKVASVIILWLIVFVAIIIVFPFLSGFTKLTLPEMINLFFLAVCLGIVRWMYKSLLT